MPVESDADLWQEGYDARAAGRPVGDCPWPPDTDYGGHSDFNPGADWLRGWHDANRALNGD